MVNAVLAPAAVGAPITEAPEAETVSAVIDWVVTMQTIDRSGTALGSAMVPVANALVGVKISHVFAAVIATVNADALGEAYWLRLMSMGRSIVPTM